MKLTTYILVSGYTVNNTTVYVSLDVILLGTTSDFPRKGPSCFLFLLIFVFCYDNIGYHYVVHPHTQYRGTMLQQGF